MKRGCFAFLTVAGLALLVACGGGGGGPSPIPGGGSTPTPPVTQTPSTQSVTGMVTETASGTPIGGATVTLGHLATSGYGWAAYGTPIAPTYTSTSDANGQFAIANVPNGSYYMTIAVDANPTVTQSYAILHRNVTIGSGNAALGALHIAKLSTDETAWLQDLNSKRATVAYPATGPVVIDEYAEEQARQWAIDVAFGKTPFNDSAYAPYQQAYSADTGAIGAVGGALALTARWEDAEVAWFAEKSNCPTLGGNGDWRTCPWQPSWGQTGHYINLAQDSAVWIGVGESSQPYVNTTTTYAFDVMTIYNGQTARTASNWHRTAP